MKVYGRRHCPSCGRMVTKNALGRAAHERSAACLQEYERRVAAALKRPPQPSTATKKGGSE